MRLRFLLAFGLAGALCAPGAALADSAPDGVFLSVAFPDSIPMNVGPPEDDTRTQDAQASLSFANLTNTSATLSAASPCEAQSWMVTDGSGAVVEGSPFCPPGSAPNTRTLDAGAQESDSKILSLHVFKYKNGETYTLHYRYWGATGDAKFTAQPTQ